MTASALDIRHLSVDLGSGKERRTVVDSVSFELRRGEVLALVGESGCGKSKTAEAIMGLLPPGRSRVRAERIRLGEHELKDLPSRAMRKFRGRDISMVFQEPRAALDPVFRVGQQVSSVFRRHRGHSGSKARTASAEMLLRVGFAEPGRVMRAYPHELSGGMCQRIGIAMAMACRPQVLIADEPTSALDVTTQAQVLAQLIRSCRQEETAVLLITHDLGVVAQYSQRALVMRQGKLVEEASVADLFTRPHNEYTRSLLTMAQAGMA
ncbi:MAG: ABC transporter ATP-binding protein [Xanthomonadales bacterium]|nr:ABC transporter ATP-binding protein [Gammaproteobacteria bacterium]MBT8049876.1 ABC transporter ATP-binding protein [Gammaproteobacteria bacterium]MBT8057091.1 ABC transporter ATP-binding protein [Gammaproteobacteria bacterium]NNJ79375.1 ABC transporter ATP-binding protein [Xanthomonadales bacterium]NNL06016.1 ABC transporter ATP-binding protein [Xanthomonadales bacterium]